jgi:histidyl-tRNA synthetase
MYGGGRYDDLQSLFGSEPIASVGFGMGDITLKNFLETHNLLPKAKFIILSNQSQQEDIEKSKELKVDLFIVKALKTPSEVVQEINKII